MAPDPGLALQEQIVATMDAEARGAVRLRLSTRALLLAWQQSDAMGPMSEMERAEFLLRRLYPTLPEAPRRQILEQLATAQAAGNWHGFRRPDPLAER